MLPHASYLVPRQSQKKNAMSNRIIEKSFLGTGWSFPPTFQAETDSVGLVSEEEDIHQSLFILMSTVPGERLMRPAYGCDLQSLVFDQISHNLRTEIISKVKRAILLHEPRITVEEIQVTISPDNHSLLYIVVNYVVRTTNSRSNIVYPFYLKEGTNVIAV